MYSTVNMPHMDTIGLWLGLKKNIQGFVCLFFCKIKKLTKRKKKEEADTTLEGPLPSLQFFLRFEGDPKIRSLRTFESFLGLISWLLYNL